ncbi:MAG: hypothetical protein JSU06_02580 [Actinobacteria bacterium]|nr:hypothetical protein [Actinomycetota bacterium]
MRILPHSSTATQVVVDLQETELKGMPCPSSNSSILWSSLQDPFSYMKALPSRSTAAQKEEVAHEIEVRVEALSTFVGACQTPATRPRAWPASSMAMQKDSVGQDTDLSGITPSTTSGALHDSPSNARARPVSSTATQEPEVGQDREAMRPPIATGLPQEAPSYLIASSRV